VLSVFIHHSAHCPVPLPTLQVGLGCRAPGPKRTPAPIKNLEHRAPKPVALMGRAAEPIATTPGELPHSQRLSPDPTSPHAFSPARACDLKGGLGGGEIYHPRFQLRPTVEVKVPYLIGLVCFFGMSAIVVVGASVFSRNMT
jgi:hypothetical protein